MWYPSCSDAHVQSVSACRKCNCKKCNLFSIEVVLFWHTTGWSSREQVEEEVKRLRTVSKQNKSWQTCHCVHFILWERLPFEWSHTLTLLYSVVTVQPFFFAVQQRNEKYCCPPVQPDADVTKIAFGGCPEQPQLPRQALVQQHSDFVITCVSYAPTKAFCCICS